MHAVGFSSGEYAKLVSSWWAQHHGIALNTRILSRFGVAVLDDNGPIAVSHLYPASTADLVFIGFTIREPSLSHFRAGKALKLLLEMAETEIKRIGYTIAYTQYDSEGLQRLCKDNGYYEGSNVREYWKELK